MFIAHIPAGYLTARLYSRLAGVEKTPALVLAGMAGGVFPDIDLLYGALMDGGRIHHHLYWTHLPFIWLAIQLASTLFFRLGKWRRARVHQGLLHAFLIGIWSHLLLDSVAGDIWWLWPWVDTPFSLVHIPAIHSPWWLNYLLHWTFAVEIAIVALAAGREWSSPVLPPMKWRPA